MMAQTPTITNILQIPPNQPDNSVTNTMTNIQPMTMTNTLHSDNLGIPALKSSGTKKKLSVEFLYILECSQIIYVQANTKYFCHTFI